MELNECKPIFASSPANWHKLVIELANYTCQICGKKGESDSLEAHHIIPLAFIEKHEKLYPLAFLIANGMAVHKNCHPGKGRLMGEQEAEEQLHLLLGEETTRILGSLGFFESYSGSVEDMESPGLLESSSSFEDIEELASFDEVLGDDIILDLIGLQAEMAQKYRKTVMRRLLALGVENVHNWTREQIMAATSYRPYSEKWQYTINRIKTAIGELHT